MTSFTLEVVTNFRDTEGSSVLSVSSYDSIRCHNLQDQNPNHVERKTLKLFWCVE